LKSVEVFAGLGGVFCFFLVWISEGSKHLRLSGDLCNMREFLIPEGQQQKHRQGKPRAASHKN